eukprot:8096171-Lingulodinium_polyedra.AAC.1
MGHACLCMGYAWAMHGLCMGYAGAMEGLCRGNAGAMHAYAWLCMFMHAYASVSYTHLTLPTICSV